MEFICEPKQNGPDGLKILIRAIDGTKMKGQLSGDQRINCYPDTPAPQRPA
jgi:hypothetical protein